jgi:hypothetical protein
MAAEGEPDDDAEITAPQSEQAALAHALLLEAIDLLSQAKELTDSEVSASLSRQVAELTTLTRPLGATTD